MFATSHGSSWIVCDHVAKLHMAVWQSRWGFDFVVGGACKVAPHQVLHLGSIEKNRGNREWASEYHVHYYMVYYYPLRHK
jgi:hypothetical protein